MALQFTGIFGCHLAGKTWVLFANSASGGEHDCGHLYCTNMVSSATVEQVKFESGGSAALMLLHFLSALVDLWLLGEYLTHRKNMDK